MSADIPVKAQFAAYNAHDIDAFLSCFTDDFKGYRMPAESPSTTGKASLRAFYLNHRFNNPELRAELLSRIVLGNKVFDHELIYGLSPEPLESVAVFEVKDNLIATAWFYFP
ncbi:nuclear transport factor 2 family protein [Erwinia psidii]|uniref:Steroid delta-isomerase n=1 Tax=Erwinia psidii TaxID=69224 RepID=A0A3N6TVY0_9GAMM|nr:nuclear transport factor 2 family protein [Erwinia psidii]MCX8957986.1 steroid delta-isomerase [Erwinia psidii]MCX8962616.1 steroid delta-isomerase [Erwinia psidii]MCX8963939.1 steroid delta-isomerase [Erwinia psidii]RQM39432.1 steroid delta-isomerase [Erwinia psidii]